MGCHGIPLATSTRLGLVLQLVVAHHTLYAYLEEPARHLVYLLRCDGRGGKVDPESSVDLNVDEAGGDDAALAVHRLVCEELVRIGSFPEAGLWVDDATVCGGVGEYRCRRGSERTNGILRGQSKEGVQNILQEVKNKGR